MFAMCNAVLNAMLRYRICAWRHWIEQWRINDQVRRRRTYTTKQNRIYQLFSERDLINDDSSFRALILSAIDLQCMFFPFEKTFCW